MPLPTTTTKLTKTHAVVETVETYINNQNMLGEVAELDSVLCNVIDMHKDDEGAMKRVLQCIYRLLQDNNRWNVTFGGKLFHKLIALLVDADSETARSRQLVANILVCVQIHARKYPQKDGDSRFVLDQLWSLSLNSEQQPHAAQILVQLFDDFCRFKGIEFVCLSQLHAVLQQLLQSTLREERKSAYFVMKKLLAAVHEADESSDYIQDMLKRGGWHNRIQFEQHWASYITIMENLEEQQSHLVLPTLNTLLPRIVSFNKEDDWLSWLRILYAKLLLDNNNILVLRWTLEYFLKHYTTEYLIRANVLHEFLVATNNTQLYNVESYFLPKPSTSIFLRSNELSTFLEILVTIQWRSVALLNWLNCLQPEEAGRPSKIAKGLLLELCACVRSLQNMQLRKHGQKQLLQLFEVTIENQSLVEYLSFIETLYNTSEEFDLGTLQRKVEKCRHFKGDIAVLSKRCFDMIMYQWNCDTIQTKTFLDYIKEFPKEQRGWWRFLVIYFAIKGKTHSELRLFLKEEYEFDLEEATCCAKLADLRQYLEVRLACKTKEEKSVTLRWAVDLFVSLHLETWNNIEKQELNALDLLDMGSFDTVHKLCTLLNEHTQYLVDNKILVELLQRTKNYSDGVDKLIHSKSLIESEAFEQLLEDLMNTSNIEVHAVLGKVSIPNTLRIRGILFGEITTGDPRIECAYLAQKYSSFFDCAIRDEYSRPPSLHLEQKLFNELLDINNEITIKKPRYFIDSKEHRFKIRIARALLNIMNHSEVKWTEELWPALLATNNQWNISYMYECIVAQLIPDLAYVLERLRTSNSVKPSQCTSLMSVLHIYCMRNWSKIKFEQLQKIISLLLPHTMGAIFQTRLLAQLVIHRFATKCEEDSIDFPLARELKKGIESMLSNQLEDYQKTEVRLMLPFLLGENCADSILYMTNTSFDECRNEVPFTKTLKHYRSAFQLKKKSALPYVDESRPTVMENENVQTKRNPINDIFPENDLELSAAVLGDHELIVVASLIDKLANLGGLARTCEVFGVKTLILDSIASVDKPDFQHLSMTAEKTLNIDEVKPTALGDFLLKKQAEGYKIVGAEQTAHSVNFAEFTFPKKCILLLGHEKHGIPVELIGFLDYAVEIPQFGMVRSLNVHVTGSLFIWEYCKQHLVQK